MQKMKPSSTPEPPEPPSPEPSSDPETLLAELQELRALNEQLHALNESLESQLTAALSAASTPLLRVGEGVRCTMLNARSLASMYVTEQKDRSNFDKGMGKWAVMADAHSLTDYLPEKEALAALARYVVQWEAILQPPSRK